MFHLFFIGCHMLLSNLSYFCMCSINHDSKGRKLYSVAMYKKKKKQNWADRHLCFRVSCFLEIFLLILSLFFQWLSENHRKIQCMEVTKQFPADTVSSKLYSLQRGWKEELNKKFTPRVQWQKGSSCGPGHLNAVLTSMFIDAHRVPKLNCGY